MRQRLLPRQGDHLYKSVSGKSYCPNDTVLGFKSRHSATSEACLLYPQKRTCGAQPGMSALGHKRTCAVH